ncbi:MAG TPA: LysM peptidoglycan-binding domain-containing protein, partial [Roseiflexaceae bacterium]|nr:LysM peptidoglycan-binding domain-containing protein [Roseiflexaceae bacterium]
MRDVSTRKLLRYFAVALVAIVCVACGSDPPRPSGTYVVKKGDTLYSIAWRHGVDYRELARWNGIGRDYAISPGQVLRLQSGAVIAQTAPKTSPKSAKPSQRPTPSPHAGPPVEWSWPVRGNATLTTRPNGGQGLTITGEL